MISTNESDRGLDPSEILRRRVMKDLDEVEVANQIIINEQVGFRRVLEILLKSGKPVSFLFAFLLFLLNLSNADFRR